METYLRTEIPFELQSLLDQELNKSERISWSCQPNVSRAVKKSMPGFIFGLIWLAIPVGIGVVMFTQYKNGKNVEVFPVVFIGLFILIGLLILSTPYWAAKKARNTVYAITNNRAIIIEKKGSSINIQSFGPDKLNDINKKIYTDGSGDLIFERQISIHTHKGKSKEHIHELGFMGIPRVNEVEDMLEALSKGKTK